MGGGVRAGAGEGEARRGSRNGTNQYQSTKPGDKRHYWQRYPGSNKGAEPPRRVTGTEISKLGGMHFILLHFLATIPPTQPPYPPTDPSTHQPTHPPTHPPSESHVQLHRRLRWEEVQQVHPAAKVQGVRVLDVRVGGLQHAHLKHAVEHECHRPRRHPRTAEGQFVLLMCPATKWETGRT